MDKKLYLEIEENFNFLTIEPMRILGLLDVSDDVDDFGTSVKTVSTDGKTKFADQCDLKGLQFTVPDTELGIQAVASALGHGMPTTKRSDDCAEIYGEWGIHRNPQGFTYFNKPVILLSTENRPGVRAAWGGLCQINDLSLFPSEELSWGYIAYYLRTGLPDGGIFVQSPSNAAIIKAEKHGDRWTVYFTSPVDKKGRIIARRYESYFRHGFNWYRKQDLLANQKK